MDDKRQLEFGAQVIEYRIVRRDRRTLEIAVEPDASVVVTAPLDAEEAKIEAKLRKRAPWVLRQQRYFLGFLPRTPARRFVAGETHLYLGRRYRLKVIRDGCGRVMLTRGHIVVDLQSGCADDDVRPMVEHWYRERADAKFAERLELSLTRFVPTERFRPTGLMIRQLERRWGSMSPAGRLLLNRQLIQAPTQCIDYVIAHELCHRAEPHHGPAFFDLLARVMPDWLARKDRLERILV